MAQPFITPTLDDADRLPQKWMVQIPHLMAFTAWKKDFTAYNDHASFK